MARYGQNFKDRAVAHLLPPESISADKLSHEIGVGTDTLERWTAAARFDAVFTTAPMDESARAAWCRTNGVYPKDLQA